MNKYINILSDKKTGNILVVFIILYFFINSIIRLYPFNNYLSSILVSIDDWGRYARYAIDIKHNGILIPSIQGNYFTPAGFLYCYFVAGCFIIFGENTVPVIIIQNIILGLSIAFIYYTFRNKMKPLTSLLFLLTLFIFAIIDINKYYTFRLLSENLGIFTISVFFYCFIKGLEKNKLSLQLTASVFLGLSILIRPNIFLFALVLIVIVSFYFIKQKKGTILNLLLFILFLIISSSFLAIRNHFVCNSWTFLPTEGISFTESLFQMNGFSFSLIFKKILFCIGVLTPLEPDYIWRPHWIIMWIGYFIYIIIRLKESRKLEVWEITTHLYIICYYILLILIAPRIGSYGFRLLVPAIFIVLPFSLMTFDKIKK